MASGEGASASTRPPLVPGSTRPPLVPGGNPEPQPSLLAAALLTAAWYTSSVLAVSTSKLSMQVVRAPLTLCATQFLSASLVTGLLLRAQGSRVLLKPRELRLVGGVTGAFTVGFVLLNLAFALAHASYVETVQSVEPISTVVLGVVLLRERETWSAYASMVLVVAGVAMASSEDAAGSLRACLATLASNFCFSMTTVLQKLLRARCPGSPAAANPVCCFFHVSWIGLLGLLPLAAVHEREALQEALGRAEFGGAWFVSILALNGLMYTAYNQLSFMVLFRVTTATHAVLNAFRRVCHIGTAAVFFGTPPSAVNLSGASIAIAGMLCFSQSKARGAKLAKAA